MTDDLTNNVPGDPTTDSTGNQSMHRQLHSQPEPEQVATARLALAQALSVDPDFDTKLSLGAALAILSDVHPPYPPLPEVLPPLPAGSAVRIARGAISEAIDSTTDIPTMMRLAAAGRELRGYCQSTDDGEQSVEGPVPT